MVKIRLKRMGTTKRPFYRLVVADARSPRDGRFIESVGFYDPLPSPAKVEIDADKVREWLRKGARPSDSARDLLVRHGILPDRTGRMASIAVAEPEPAQAAAVSAVAAAPEPAAGDTAVSAETSAVALGTGDSAAATAEDSGDEAGDTEEA